MDTNQTSSGASMASPEKHGGNGFWGIITVIIILIVGGILLLNSEKNVGEDSGTDVNIDISSEDEYAVPTITGTSDDTASIAADMEEMDFSDIDQGL